MKHVIVTGASGFLGSVVASHLLAQGWKVTALNRSRLHSNQPGLEAIALDIAQDPLSVLPTDASAVVHCAAAIPASYADLEGADTLLRVNGLGTLRLLAWAKQHGISRFINCSSHAVYQQPVPLPIPESHPAYPSGHATYYAVSKLAAEIYVSSMNGEGFYVCSLRFSSLYGSGMKASGVLPRFIASASRGEALVIRSDPASLFDFLHVDDAARAISACLTRPLSHTVYNIGAGQGTTLQMLAEKCWAEFGPPEAPLIRWDHPSASPTHSVLDITRAQQNLGYRPLTGLAAGLHQIRLQM